MGLVHLVEIDSTCAGKVRGDVMFHIEGKPPPCLDKGINSSYSKRSLGVSKKKGEVRKDALDIGYVSHLP